MSAEDREKAAQTAAHLYKHMDYRQWKLRPKMLQNLYYLVRMRDKTCEVRRKAYIYHTERKAPDFSHGDISDCQWPHSAFKNIGSIFLLHYTALHGIISL